MDVTTARVYEDFFVPALFGQWGERLADAAEVREGDRVLDVACGTGAFARAVAARIGAGGTVTGLDSSEGMLAVAREIAPGIAWHLGSAESMPFGDNSFDVVGSQFGLMFFSDRAAALRQMMRVLVPHGRLVVAVWDSLDNASGYAELVMLLAKLFGESVAEHLRAPFALGNPGDLKALAMGAGITTAAVSTRMGHARFSSIRDWMHTDVRGWLPAGAIDEQDFETLVRTAETALVRFVSDGGVVEFPMPAHILTATKV